MNTFQAIQKFNYVKPNPVFVMHSRVIELDTDVTAAAAAYNRQKNVGQRGGLLVKERKQNTEYLNASIVDMSGKRISIHPCWLHSQKSMSTIQKR